MVQSVCLTSRGSGVRIPQLPQPKAFHESERLFSFHPSTSACHSPPAPSTILPTRSVLTTRHARTADACLSYGHRHARGQTCASRLALLVRAATTWRHGIRTTNRPRLTEQQKKRSEGSNQEVIHNKRPPLIAEVSECWATKIRTWNDRTRICSVTITP